MRADIYWIRDIEPMRLALMPRPRGGDWLQGEVANWKSAGIDLVLSLLRDYELNDLGLSAEAKECEEHGIEYRSFPISDRGTPESLHEFIAMVDELALRLRDGVAIAVHCRAGIGRSSITAGAFLLRSGVPADKIFPMISRARGLSVPDTQSQIDWFSGLAKRLSAPSTPRSR
jgi:protein-tyrosine phosphatase